jgi:hypothetical protein
VDFSFILGLGISVSAGRVTVNNSGAGQWYLTVGLGAGFDVGVMGKVMGYRDIGSFSGYNDVANVAVPLPPIEKTVGGSAAFDINGDIVGGSFGGTGVTGLPGLEAGASGQSTQTVLFGGPCSG